MVLLGEGGNKTPAFPSEPRRGTPWLQNCDERRKLILDVAVDPSWPLRLKVRRFVSSPTAHRGVVVTSRCHDTKKADDQWNSFLRIPLAEHVHSKTTVTTLLMQRLWMRLRYCNGIEKAKQKYIYRIVDYVDRSRGGGSYESKIVTP